MDTSAAYVGEVLAIFSKYWIQDSRPDFVAASAALCESTTNAKDPGQYISSTLLALHKFASARPNSIDFLARVYAAAVDEFPNSLEGEYGVGQVAGEEQLSWWLVDETNFFKETDRPIAIEGRDPHDPSNIDFNEKDVGDRLADVLTRTQEWRAERNSLIIFAAIQARCFALEIVRVKFPHGYEVESLIDCAIERREGKLSLGDFIAGCVLLRGCAKSLIDALLILGKTDKLDRWKSMFKSFVCSNKAGPLEEHNGNDWVVKLNAAVSPHQSPGKTTCLMNQ